MEVQVRLTVGDMSGSAEVEHEATVRSPHTGEELHTATVRIRGAGTGWETVQQQLEAPGAVVTDPDSGRVYHARVTQSMTSSDGSWSFALDLTEEEHVKPTALIIDGVRLTPVRYSESVTNGVIIIETQVETKGQTTEALEGQLRRQREFRPVIREGVQGQPRSMRFGRCAWSRHSDMTKYRLALVEEGFDDDLSADAKLARDLYAPPEKQNVEQLLLDLGARFEALLDALDRRGVIDSDTREAVVGKKAEAGSWLKLVQVDDVDDEYWPGDGSEE